MWANIEASLLKVASLYCPTDVLGRRLEIIVRPLVSLGLLLARCLAKGDRVAAPHQSLAYLDGSPRSQKPVRGPLCPMRLDRCRRVQEDSVSGVHVVRTSKILIA